MTDDEPLNQYQKANDSIDDYDYNKRIYYFEYDDNEDWNYVKPFHRKITLETPCCEAYILIGSFNGLICIYGSRPTIPDASGPAIIFNPVTKEFIVLPDFDCYPEYDIKGENSRRCYHLACGFGYLAGTNEYKVVRICDYAGEPKVVEVEVYTVGSGKGWRRVGKFDFGFRFNPHWEHTHGVFLNEALYWKNTDGGMIVVFDLAGEKY
ncbi:putative F-box protein At1g32420 [Papaver somniferum]|uniref:putative F-box protein At1g32420 n=1 Tax=Papaver somniferum TaxID=3469 RepID=UPI000E6F912D|nr:putative F-box protein At1g32420 [Papaver somniferum]